MANETGSAADREWVLHTPYAEPTRHWQLDEHGRAMTSTKLDRRPSSTQLPVPSPRGDESDWPAWFEDRVLPIDTGVADEWGRLMARLKKPMPAIDGLIAATALRHRFAIVTRNESDFAATGADLLNPWKD